MDNPNLDAAFAEAMDGLGADGLPERAMTELDLAVAELNQTYFVAPVGGSSTRIARLVRDEGLGRERLGFSRAEDIKLLFANQHYVVSVAKNGNEAQKGLGEALLNHQDRRTYERIALIPQGPCPP